MKPPKSFIEQRPSCQTCEHMVFFEDLSEQKWAYCDLDCALRDVLRLAVNPWDLMCVLVDRENELVTDALDDKCTGVCQEHRSGGPSIIARYTWKFQPPTEDAE